MKQAPLATSWPNPLLHGAPARTWHHLEGQCSQKHVSRYVGKEHVNHWPYLERTVLQFKALLPVLQHAATFDFGGQEGLTMYIH